MAAHVVPVHIPEGPGHIILRMRYEVTTFVDVLDRCQELIRENFAETGEGPEMDIDAELYEQLDELGRGFGIVVSDGGKPVAYAAIIVVGHPHSGEVTAENDTIFVTAGKRHGTVPGRLVLACEEEARRRGCTRIQWDAPTGSSFERALAKRPAYRAIQTMYLKDLK